MKITKTKKKLIYLITGIFLNILSVLGSLFLPSSISKFSYAPFNFIWEFFTINWCVWNSSLTTIYNLNELKNERQRNKIISERQKNFGLIVAVGNLVAIVIFTSILFKPALLPESRSIFWWTNALIWHYVAPIISLIYYFKFAKIKKSDFQKKSLFYIVAPMPIFFFLANLIRRFSANPKYLGKELKFNGKELKFKKFLISPFQWAEKGKFTLLALFIVFGILSFWFIGWLLLKIKKYYFTQSKTKKLTSQKFKQS
jgi:hypothetical protein